MTSPDYPILSVPGYGVLRPQMMITQRRLPGSATAVQGHTHAKSTFLQRRLGVFHRLLSAAIMWNSHNAVFNSRDQYPLRWLEREC